MPTFDLPLFWVIFFAYVAAVSFWSVVVCIYDKSISKWNSVRLRASEKALFVLSVLGGSLVMFITMLLIRHKTKHVSFMVGIPAIFILQVALVAVLAYLNVLPPFFCA